MEITQFRGDVTSENAENVKNQVKMFFKRVFRVFSRRELETGFPIYFSVLSADYLSDFSEN